MRKCVRREEAPKKASRVMPTRQLHPIVHAPATAAVIAPAPQTKLRMYDPPAAPCGACT